MTEPARILPTPDEAVTAFVDGVVAARPSAAKHFNLGRGKWHHLAVMVRAQAALAIARLADEVRQHRLPLADAQGLRELLESEYLASVDTGGAPARGTFALNRATALTSGVIPAGRRFVKRANPAGVPLPIAAAEYEAIRSVVVPAGVTDVNVDVRATRPGPDGNIARETEAPFTAVKPSDELFDTFTVTSAQAAGGTLGIDDAGVRSLAHALARGQRGPTDAAILAGALSGAGVRYAATEEDTTSGRTKLYVADESWGSSVSLSSEVVQAVRDDWAGFGTVVDAFPVANVFVNVAATVLVRDARYFADTSEIQDNVQQALRAYFDDRPDWYTWRLSTIRAVIARADRRLMTCTTATVQDRNGTTWPEPTGSFSHLVDGLAHYYLAANAVTLTFDYPA